MKTIALILSLSLCSTGNAGWFLSDEESRKYQIPVAKPQVQVKEITISQSEYNKIFGDRDRALAMKAHFDKIRRESPDYVLFAPSKVEQPKLTQVNQPALVNIAIKPNHIVQPHDKVKAQEVKQVQAQRPDQSWIKDAARAIVSAVKAIVIEIRNAINSAAGAVFGIISGDSFRRQESFKFDPTPGKPAVIGATGMASGRRDMEAMRGILKKAFNVSDVVMVKNNTGPLRLLSDIAQTLGYEILGSYDKPVHSMKNAIREGIKQKGEVFVAGHSQGGEIIALALRGLTKDERARVHIHNSGSAWFLDEKRLGLGSVRNVKNHGDPIPGLANRWNISNYVNPSHFGRSSGNWDKINVRAIGNEHSFRTYYKSDVEEWSKKMMSKNK